LLYHKAEPFCKGKNPKKVTYYDMLTGTKEEIQLMTRQIKQASRMSFILLMTKPSLRKSAWDSRAWHVFYGEDDENTWT